MLRKNVPGGREQLYFLYFHEPGDVRRTAFLVWKYPKKGDDRWIFIPAVNMTRRIAARDSRSSFVGSDFSCEDISGRDLGADSHTLPREEKLGDSSCYVVQSTPKTAAEFSRKLSWIDKTSWLPLKEEYYVARINWRAYSPGRIPDFPDTRARDSLKRPAPARTDLPSSGEARGAMDLLETVCMPCRLGVE